ncbi:MAG: DMT family transporter [Candidatus Eremiobacteraeota bacterium]|nr:DMT family transporter [Candidatus Eremiobacteraeota bacterium]
MTRSIDVSSARPGASTAYTLLVLTALFWAGNWVLARGIQVYMSPIAMAFWRWLAALVILLPFVTRPIVREWGAVRRSWKILVPLGIIGVGAFNTLTYTGLKYTTATNGVLLNSVIPILVIAINTLVLRERLAPMQAAGVLTSLSGVVMIVARGELDTLRHLRLNPGDLWVLSAMLGWAIYTVCLRWRPRELSSSAFTGSLIAVGVAVLLPVFAWDYDAGHRTLWGPVTWGAVAYLAIFTSVLAYYFWNTAVARVGGERASTFLHLMPLFGAVLSAAFLGESLLWYHYAGALLIFAGIAIASRSPTMHSR